MWYMNEWMNEWKALLKKIVSNGETSLNSFAIVFCSKIQLPFNNFICDKQEKTNTPKADANNVLSGYWLLSCLEVAHLKCPHTVEMDIVFLLVYISFSFNQHKNGIAYYQANIFIAWNWGSLCSWEHKRELVDATVLHRTKQPAVVEFHLYHPWRWFLEQTLKNETQVLLWRPHSLLQKDPASQLNFTTEHWKPNIY